MRKPNTDRISYGMRRALERATKLAASRKSGRLHRWYDSSATPCRCVMSRAPGSIETTVVVSWTRRARTVMRCMSCDCEWYEPEHPWRGLNPGPDGFTVLRQGVA